jgi:hypothetical protein
MLVLFVVTLPVALAAGAAQFALMGPELVALLRPLHAFTPEIITGRLETVMARHMPEIIGINLIAAPFQTGLAFAAAAFGYTVLSAGQPAPGTGPTPRP